MDKDIQHMIDLSNRIGSLMKDSEKAGEIRKKAKMKALKDAICEREFQMKLNNIEMILDNE